MSAGGRPTRLRGQRCSARGRGAAPLASVWNRSGSGRAAPGPVWCAADEPRVSRRVRRAGASDEQHPATRSTLRRWCNTRSATRVRRSASARRRNGLPCARGSAGRSAETSDGRRGALISIRAPLRAAERGAPRRYVCVDLRPEPAPSGARALQRQRRAGSVRVRVGALRGHPRIFHGAMNRVMQSAPLGSCGACMGACVVKKRQKTS